LDRRKFDTTAMEKECMVGIKQGDFCIVRCRPGFKANPIISNCQLNTKNNKLEFTPKFNCDEEINSIGPQSIIHSSSVYSRNDKDNWRHVTFFISYFDTLLKIPILTIHYIPKISTNLYRPRQIREYFQSPLIEKSRQLNKNSYNGKPYDKGHLVTRYDMMFDRKTELASNQYINIAPQNHENNEKWAQVEKKISSLSGKVSDLFIITGVFIDEQTVNSDIVIPKYFYKLIAYKNRYPFYNIVVAGFTSDNITDSDGKLVVYSQGDLIKKLSSKSMPNIEQKIKEMWERISDFENIESTLQNTISIFVIKNAITITQTEIDFIRN
jgi:DNA/RNA endonuclease G (NUC1)